MIKLRLKYMAIRAEKAASRMALRVLYTLIRKIRQRETRVMMKGEIRPAHRQISCESRTSNLPPLAVDIFMEGRCPRPTIEEKERNEETKSA